MQEKVVDVDEDNYWSWSRQDVVVKVEGSRRSKTKVWT